MPTLAAFSTSVLRGNLNYPDSLFLGLVLKDFIELARNAQEASELTLYLFVTGIGTVFYVNRSATVLCTEFDDLSCQSMIIGVNPVLLLLPMSI